MVPIGRKPATGEHESSLKILKTMHFSFIYLNKDLEKQKIIIFKTMLMLLRAPLYSSSFVRIKKVDERKMHGVLIHRLKKVLWYLLLCPCEILCPAP